MAKPPNLTERKAATVRKVLDFVQAEAESLPWNAGADQLGKLQALIDEQKKLGLELKKGRARKGDRDHDASSLREAVLRALREHAGMAGSANNLFKDGISAVPERFLQAIHFRPAERPQRDERAILVQAATSQLELPVHEKVDQPTSSSSPTGLKDPSRVDPRPVPEGEATGPRGEKRKSLDDHVEEDYFESPEKSDPARQRSKRRSDASSSSPNTQQGPGKDGALGAQQTTVTDCRETIPGLYVGRSAQAVAMTGPPARKQISWRDLHDASVGIGTSTVAGSLARIENNILTFALRIATPNLGADFVREPEAHLCALYETVFGSDLWSTRILHMRRTVRLRGCTLLASLIGTWLYVNIFNKSSPWRVERQIESLSGPLWSEVDIILKEKGLDLDGVLNQAAFRLLTNAEFQQHRLPHHVATWTTDLSATILDQISLFRAAKSNSKAPVPMVQPADWYVELESIVRECALLKAKMETTPRVTWEWLWFEGGAKYQPRRMFSSGTNVDDQTQVGVTVMPGLLAHHFGGSTGPDCVKPATVVACKRLPGVPLMIGSGSGDGMMEMV